MEREWEPEQVGRILNNLDKIEQSMLRMQATKSLKEDAFYVAKVITIAKGKYFTDLLTNLKRHNLQQTIWYHDFFMRLCVPGTKLAPLVLQECTSLLNSQGITFEEFVLACSFADNDLTIQPDEKITDLERFQEALSALQNIDTPQRLAVEKLVKSQSKR